MREERVAAQKRVCEVKVAEIEERMNKSLEDWLEIYPHTFGSIDEHMEFFERWKAGWAEVGPGQIAELRARALV